MKSTKTTTINLNRDNYKVDFISSWERFAWMKGYFQDAINANPKPIFTYAVAISI